MSLADSAANGAATTLGGQWIRFVVQLASLMVLARLLSPSDFGSMAMVTAIAGIATVLGDFGLSMAAIQANELSRTQKSNLFWLNVAIGTLSALIIVLLSGPIASFYRSPDLQPIVQLLGLLFIFNACQSQYRAEASRLFKFKALAIADVGGVVVAFVVAVTVAILGGGYWALVAQQYTITLITLAILISTVRWVPGMPRRGAEMKPLITFGANTVGVQLVNYISSNVDTVLLGRVWGPTVLGFYDRAFQLFRLPMLQIAAPLTRVAFPILSRVDDPATFNRFVQKAQLILTYVIGGVFIVASACASPLIDVALGPGWDESKPLFQILALGGVFQVASYVYYWIFLSKALMSVQLRYSIIGRVLMVIYMIIGLPFGAVGVAIGSACGLATLWLIYSTLGVRKAGIATGPLVLTALRPVIVFGFIGAALVALQLLFIGDWASWLQLLILGFAFLVLLTLAFAFIPIVRRDLFDIGSAARRVLKKRK